MLTLKEYYELSKYSSAKNISEYDSKETMDEIDQYISSKIDQSMSEL